MLKFKILQSREKTFIAKASLSGPQETNLSNFFIELSDGSMTSV